MDLPDSAWHIVTQHLPAQPILYMRMATVNKKFYKVFMSDQVWARVDVCGIERMIAKHFVSKMLLESPEQLDLMRRVYEDKVDLQKDDMQLFALLNSRNLHAIYTAYTVPHAHMLNLGVFLVARKLSLAHRMMAESGCVEYLVYLELTKELALMAVSFNGLKLAQLPEPLRHDRDVVLAAVRNNGLALEFAGARFQRDTEILHAAVFQNGMPLEWAPVMTQFGTIFSGVSDSIILTAIKNNFRAARWLGENVLAHPHCSTAVDESRNALAILNDPACDPSRAWVVSRPRSGASTSYFDFLVLVLV